MISEHFDSNPLHAKHMVHFPPLSLPPLERSALIFPESGSARPTCCTAVVINPINIHQYEATVSGRGTCERTCRRTPAHASDRPINRVRREESQRQRSVSYSTYQSYISQLAQQPLARQENRMESVLQTPGYPH